MLKDLPEFVQKQVLKYLESGNFRAAKSLHDAWISHQPHTTAWPYSTNLNAHNVARDFLPEGKVVLIEGILNSD